MNQQYDPYERKLANEIADALKDRDSITMHLQYVRKYKEEFLRRILNKVMSLPESSIKKSRAALYTFLINQSAKHGDIGY
jgi:ribosomal protein S7